MTDTVPNISIIHVAVPPPKAGPAPERSAEALALSTPKIEPGGDRTVDQVWEIDSSTDEDGTVVRHLVVLSTYHDVGRRRFRSTLMRQTERREAGRRAVRSFLAVGGQSVPFPSVSVARYSAQGLADAAAHARALVIAKHDDPAIVAIFTAPAPGDLAA